MSVFSKDLEKTRAELKKAQIKRKFYRIITVGLIRFDNITEDAEFRYQEAKSASDKYNSLLDTAKILDDDLLNYIKIEGIRISKNAFADFSRIGAEGYPKDWKNLREIVLNRDNYNCQEMDKLCDGPLQIHHIISLSNNGSNNINNLVTLCLYHHSQKHDHMRRKYFGNLRSRY